MKQERAIEIVTYILVFLSMWVVSPWVGKFLDRFYYPFPNTFTDSLWLAVTGGMIALFGLGLVFWTIAVFKTLGRGTPNPKLPPKELVLKGPYRYSRNPMAFGGFLFLLGEAGVYQSPSLAGLTMLYALVLYLNTVYVEEPELRKRFGAPYENYCHNVPRFAPLFFWSKKN